MIGIAFLNFIVLGFNAGLMGVVWPSMRASFGLSLDAIGALMMLSTLVSLAISFSSGPLIARVGLGRLLTIGCLISGFAGSPLFPLLTSNTPDRLGAEHAANAIGFQITAVKLGLAAIPALVGVLAEALGLEMVGPALFAIATIMFLLHEAIVPRSKNKGFAGAGEKK